MKIKVWQVFILQICALSLLRAEKIELGVGLGQGSYFSDLERRTFDDGLYANGSTEEGQAHGSWSGNFSSPHANFSAAYLRELTGRAIKDENKDPAIFVRALQSLQGAVFKHGVTRVDRTSAPGEVLSSNGTWKNEMSSRNLDLEGGLQLPAVPNQLFFSVLGGQRQHDLEHKFKGNLMGMSTTWLAFSALDSGSTHIKARALGQYAGGGLRYKLSEYIWFVGEYRHFPGLQGTAEIQSREDEFFYPLKPESAPQKWIYRQTYSAARSRYELSGYSWNAGLRVDFYPWMHLHVNLLQNEFVSRFPNYATFYGLSLLSTETNGTVGTSSSVSSPINEREFISDYFIYGRKQSIRSSTVTVGMVFDVTLQESKDELFY